MRITRLTRGAFTAAAVAAVVAIVGYLTAYAVSDGMILPRTWVDGRGNQAGFHRPTKDAIEYWGGGPAHLPPPIVVAISPRSRVLLLVPIPALWAWSRGREKGWGRGWRAFRVACGGAALRGGGGEHNGGNGMAGAGWTVAWVCGVTAALMGLGGWSRVGGKGEVSTWGDAHRGRGM